MSRTQDLVLARLRLVALRWQSGPAAVAADNPGDGAAATESPDPLIDDPPAAGEWPASGLWVRLVGILMLVVLSGAVVLVAATWPRERTPEPLADRGMSEPEAVFADPFPSASASASPAPSVLVHVVGEVRRPGVVRLPAGSRVADGVEQAGGLRSNGEVGATNLAREVTDGERIEVGAPEGTSGVDPSASTSDAPLVDLNAATADQLDALPGVGPVTAAKILAWRSEHGRFTVVDELAEVAGIGPKTLAELRSLVRV